MVRELRALKLGETLGESFSLYTENFLPLFLVSAVLSTISQFAAGGVTAAVGTVGSALGGGGIIGTLVSMVVISILPAFLIDYMSRVYTGQQVSMRDTYQTVLPRIPGVIGVVILVAIFGFGPGIIGLSIGSVLLVGGTTGAGIVGVLIMIPAVVLTIILTLSLALSLPVYMSEGTTVMGAIRRSRQLSKGYKGRIFGYYLVTNGLAMLFSFIAGGILGLLPVGYAFFQIATGVISGIVLPFTYGVMVLLYFTLRIEKEGFDLEYLADQFPTSGAEGEPPT